MKLSKFLYLIFVLIKPFYVFKSGGIQPADFFLIFSFISYVYSRDYKITIHKYDKLFLLFLGCVIFINGLYIAIYQNFSFFLPILYYTSNLFVIILFREFIKDKEFINKIIKILKLNIIIQIFIYILRLGRWYRHIRYMGTFNDPNQMAFFLFMTLLIMYIISKINTIEINFFYNVVIIFLIFETASTGISLALLTFIFLNIFFGFQKNIKWSYQKLIKVCLGTIFILVLISIIDVDFQTILNESDLWLRIEEKLLKSSNQFNTNASSYSELSIIQERGIDKLVLYPQKILYGAGEGLFNRFSKAGHMGEIHSTLPSILFYYGMIPFTILLKWFKKNIGVLNRTIIIVFIPLLIESFTLLNQRQPFFWMLFILAYELNKDKKNPLIL